MNVNLHAPLSPAREARRSQALSEIVNLKQRIELLTEDRDVLNAMAAE